VTLEEFKARLHDGSAPPVSPLLQALWYDHRGDWEEAHRIAQDIDGPQAAHVHAYLHRKEGDAGNVLERRTISRDGYLSRLAERRTIDP
jgi:hypothetical protein